MRLLRATCSVVKVGQTKAYRDSCSALESYSRESRSPRGEASTRPAPGSKQPGSLWPEKTFCLGDFGQHFNKTPEAALSFWGGQTQIQDMEATASSVAIY